MEGKTTNIPVEVNIGTDSHSAYVMESNPTYSRRTRHTELRWHFVREQLKLKNVMLERLLVSTILQMSSQKRSIRHVLHDCLQWMGIQRNQMQKLRDVYLERGSSK